jgi:hypothetical protein
VTPAFFSSARNTAAAYRSGRFTVISRLPDRPFATRPRSVIVFEPCARLAEKLVAVPFLPVVVRFFRLRYDDAAAGLVVILAFLPADPAR